MKFEINQSGSEWRWQLRAADDHIVAVSADSYPSHAECVAALGAIWQEVSDAIREALFGSLAQPLPPPPPPVLTVEGRPFGFVVRNFPTLNATVSGVSFGLKVEFD